MRITLQQALVIPILLTSISSCTKSESNISGDNTTLEEEESEESEEQESVPQYVGQTGLIAFSKSCGFLTGGEHEARFVDSFSDCQATCYAALSCESASYLVCQVVYELPEAERLALRDCLETCRIESSFACGDGTTTSSANVCDLEQDCLNGSDEVDCSNHPNTFQCDDGELIWYDFRCDTGTPDCVDGSDEMNCASYENVFVCDDPEQILALDYRCDGGTPDCDDGSDEQGCDNPALAFQCGDGSYTHPSFQCDGSDDCDNGADETGCASLTCPSPELELPER